MNERIRLLAEQAGLVGGGYANGTKIMTWRESFDNPGSLEKFAELIIKECAEQIIAKGTDWMDFAPSQLGIRPEYAAMAKHIKEHFGVEE